MSTFAMLSAHTAVMFTPVTAYAFMVFVLLAVPCVAAIGAIRREMGNWKWTLIAIGYQTGVAYVMGTLVNLIGGAIFPIFPPFSLRRTGSRARRLITRWRCWKPDIHILGSFSWLSP